MSGGGRLPLTAADALAAELLDLLGPACERLQVAGSIRRRRAEVGDLEIVAIPRYGVGMGQADLFGNVSTPAVNLLDERCAELLERGAFTPRLDRNGRPALGSKYQRLLYRDFGLDLFITTPAQWGVILTLRTGPADYSHRLVTSTRQGGLLPAWLQVKDGLLQYRSTGEVTPTPTEESFFEALQLPLVDPWRRS